ncbi:MAG TPA: SDR family oxidoreductase [Solirubrobacteraceae bacterium]|nr:SDR family oxidoreductase [Solirubrobacteraceae bacterium]
MTVALVTGAGRGLGEAIARRLAADGHAVVGADLAGAEETADLGDAEQVRALAERVLARHGRVDVLVNNAAQLGGALLAELELESWRRFHAVNVEAPMLLCQALVPAMAAAGRGRVVNIVSNTVWEPPGPGMLAYITTKGALLGFTRALAVEVGGSGVTVNAVAPGLTPTPGSRAGQPPAAFAAAQSQQAIDRPLSPEDVAGAVSYLASDDAAAVTGQALRVDGGLVTL